MATRVLTQGEMEKIPHGSIMYCQATDGCRIYGRVIKSVRKSGWIGMTVKTNMTETWYRININLYQPNTSPYFLLNDAEAMLWKLENE